MEENKQHPPYEQQIMDLLIQNCRISNPNSQFHEGLLNQQQHNEQNQQFHQGHHQFQQMQAEQKLNYLESMGFQKRGKNRGLLRRFNGDVQQVIQVLLKNQENQDKDQDQDQDTHVKGHHDKSHRHHHDQSQEGAKDQNYLLNGLDVQKMLKKTQILIIDCNNVMWADTKIMKKSEYRIASQPMLQQFFKYLIIWTLSSGNNLNKVKLIWDYLNFKQLENSIDNDKCNKNMTNVRKPVKKIITEKSHELKLQMQEVIQKMVIKENKSLSVNLNLRLLVESKKVEVEILIISALPEYKIADDLIVQEVKTSLDEIKMQTTVVTSDIKLRERLQIEGISSFIGNGQFCKMLENMRKQIRQRLMKQQ